MNTGATVVLRKKYLQEATGATSSRRKRVINIVKHWTESELNAELSKLAMIVDSREQDPHCENWFRQNNIPFVRRKLEAGDYSAMLGDYTLENDVFVERKADLTEICGNFTTNRERFEREFTRAKAIGAKPFLLIENDSFDDVYLGNYRSKVKPKSLIGSLLTWQTRYNATILFCSRKNSPKLIYGIMYYVAREILTHGNGR